MSKITQNHVVMYSGGLGSFGAAWKLRQELPIEEKITLLFSNTLIEDDDLYRFLTESANAIKNSELVKVTDGRTPWDVYKEVRFVSHRTAKCSEVLKYLPARSWVESFCDRETTQLYIGIDWTEKDERLPRITEKWKPYQMSAPLCEGNQWWDKSQIEEVLKTLSIKKPRLYDLGFTHNNCGGFCCRAGKKQFFQLLTHFPDRYAYHAQQEQEFRQLLSRDDVGILREVTKGVTKIVPLTDFAKRGRQLDLFGEIEESSTCGCFGGTSEEKKQS